MKKTKMISFAMVGLLIASVFFAPAMNEVEANGGYTNISQYTKTQTYLGDSGKTYYADLTYSGYTPKITPNTKGNVGFYIADFDGDGADELLTLRLNANYQPEISISELEAGNIVEKVYVSTNTSQLIPGALQEDGNINCFVFPKNGKTYIGIEEKTSTRYLANGIGLGVVTYTYDNGKLIKQFSDSDAGSDFYDYDANVNGYKTERDSKLRNAGINCTLGTILYSGLNTNYSDYISGSKKVAGIIQRVAIGRDEFNYGSNKKNYAKVTFYNRGNGSSGGSSSAPEPFSIYQGHSFVKEGNGAIRCYDSSGAPVINQFKCDGTYTYYFQADGTAMKDRLTYHPDGVHVIYFDGEGHEVFSNFAHVKKSIANTDVDDFCFFDVYGHLYVDVLTYDQAGQRIYYANPYGVMEVNKWFQFSNNVKWADGTPADANKNQYGFANYDGTLATNGWTYDFLGRWCYLQGNGAALY